MPDYTVKSLEVALRGMPPGAPIPVRVEGTLRAVSLVSPTWIAGGAEDDAAAKGSAVCGGAGPHGQRRAVSVMGCADDCGSLSYRLISPGSAEGALDLPPVFQLKSLVPAVLGP
jgi:hypothetical protein